MPGAPFCSHCGQSMTRPVAGPWDVVLKVLAVVLLIFVACPAGAAGGCALLVGSTGSEGLQVALFGLIGLVLAGAIVWFATWAFRRR